MTEDTTATNPDERFTISEVERSETTLELQPLRKGVRPLRIIHMGGEPVSITISTLLDRSGMPDGARFDGARFRVFRHDAELVSPGENAFQLKMHGFIHRINHMAATFGEPVLYDTEAVDQSRDGASEQKIKRMIEQEVNDKFRHHRMYTIDCVSQVVKVTGPGACRLDEVRQPRLQHHLRESMAKMHQDLKAGMDDFTKMLAGDDDETPPTADGEIPKPYLQVGLVQGGSGCIIATNQLLLAGVAVAYLRIAAELACREWVQE